jgi:NAD(P)-dependent dehydrogenase (short-subunit alcohol dehydrogenase family)
MNETMQINAGEVALIVGGGPGISASCARLFSRAGMRVVVAARNPDKPVLKALTKDHGAQVHACDASDADAVAKLFADVQRQLGTPKLVVHNIDGRTQEVFRQSISEVDPMHALVTLTNSTYSAFLVGQQAARQMLARAPDKQGHRGTILFTNASAAIKGYPRSGAFAMASHGKSGLAQSMARELMPAGIHVAHIPIDAAVGWTQADGTRSHRLAGTSVDDNMADPDHIAEVYLQLHNQHRSTWAYEVILRPWVENW